MTNPSLTLEQRVAILERVLTTTSLVNINALASLLTILHKLPSFDSSALITELTELKAYPGDADPVQFSVLVDLLILRLKAPKISQK
jgi:hypothetical protein